MILLILFTFIQISDTHIQSDENTTNPYPLVTEKLEWFVDECNRLNPDFVIVTGDIIQGERQEFLLPDMLEAKSILDKLNMPCYPVIGNHETIQQQNNTQVFTEVFNVEPDYYFVKNGYLFVALNTSGFTINQRYIEMINLLYDNPKILLTHVPLELVRDESVLSQSFGFPSYQIKCVLPENTMMILSGHLHLTGVKDKQIVCSGFASLPCDYIYYEVYEDSIIGTIYSLPDKFTSVSESLHGKPRYSVDYTDSEHSTAYEYISGNKDERKFKVVK